MNAEPVGAFLNDQWANFTIGHCGEDSKEAQDLGAKSIKSFLGPDRPYTHGRKDVYAKLLEAWGGVPDDLKANFSRFVDNQPGVEGGADLDHAMWEKMDSQTLAERGVIVVGNPDGCAEGVRRHLKSGADQLMLLIANRPGPA